MLPDNLSTMSYGSRSLIRPIHSFGRLASFQNSGGMRLTGHVYSNKLNTPFVRKKLPINPTDLPVRVLVVSPMSTDESTLARAKLASIRKDYIIDREQISNTIRFFKDNGNKLFESIEFDEDELNRLPDNDVSSQMFHEEQDEDKGNGKKKHLKKIKRRGSDFLPRQLAKDLK